MQNLLSTLTDELQSTWELFEESQSSLRTAEAQNDLAQIRQLNFIQLEESGSEDVDSLGSGDTPSLPVDPKVIEQLRRESEDSLDSFKAQLTEDQLIELNSIVQEQKRPGRADMGRALTCG